MGKGRVFPSERVNKPEYPPGIWETMHLSSFSRERGKVWERKRGIAKGFAFQVTSSLFFGGESEIDQY